MFEAEYCNGSDYFIGLTFSVFTPTPNWLAILNHVWTLGFGVCPSFFKANSWRKTLRSDIDCYVSCSSPGLISQVTTQEFAEKLEKEVSKPSATQRNLFDKTGMFCRPYFWRCLSRAAGEVVFFLRTADFIWSSSEDAVVKGLNKIELDIRSAIFRDCLLLCCWFFFHQRTEISSGMFWVSVILSHVFWHRSNDDSDASIPNPNLLRQRKASWLQFKEVV